MKGVRIDPLAQTVRAKGGATTGELDHVSQAFGQAVPMGIVTETGIAGLTLAHMPANPGLQRPAPQRRQTDPEIRRCLKRYIARELYRCLNTTIAT
jgi:hypothetical protein